MRQRMLIISLLLLAVAISHWITPTDVDGLHALHVLLRKLFILPVVLAAIWFNLRGGILAACAATVLYLPHVFFQWGGQTGENLNQIGELASLWLIAGLVGFLMDREKTILQNLARSNEGALLALIGAMDARRHKREYHAVRVNAYAERIARELKLPSHDLETLGKTSVLHDLGMIGLPDDILFDPGPLDEQKQTIREHPRTGYNILRRVPALREAAEIVYAHHERYDGTGYPRGLRGDQIPFVARVFAVADVFDALTTDRPHRPAIRFDQARKVIESERGLDFDPQVVDAFVQVPQSEWLDILRGLESHADTFDQDAQRLETEVIP